MSDLIQVIENFGVTVAVLIAMMWYIVYKDKNHKEESRLYTETIQKNTDAMADMRVVLERLATIISDGKEGGADARSGS